MLPLFLANTLGLSKSLIGLIQGLADFFGNITKLFAGWFSDVIKKRKTLLFIGYSISTITKPLMAFSMSASHVITARMGDRFGKGIRSAPKNALLTESTSKENRGKWFGFDQAMDTAGAILGTILAYFLVSSYVGLNYRTVFLLSIIPAAIALLIIIFFVKDVAAPKIKDEAKKLSLDFKKFSLSYKYFLFVATIFSLANFTYAFFLLKAQDLGFIASSVILLYFVYNLFYAGLSIPAGRLSDKVGRRKVIITGYILFVLTCVGFTFLTDHKDIWILFALYGTSIALTDSVSRAYIGDLAPSDKKASAQGIYYATTGTALLIGAITAGKIWDSFGSFYTFLYATIISSIAFILLIIGMNLIKTKITTKKNN
ncbi:MAG: MFS transporter [Nanoarchaeota archaeon]|nr:MFS transporter [Nanoarchaeota archaeon]